MRWRIKNSNLKEIELFAVETSLINAFNYVSDARFTNIVAKYYLAEALSVGEREEKDIKHKILVIKINKLYKRSMDEKVLYDAVLGIIITYKKK